MIPYIQTTPFTCAASSLLTILHYYNNKISLSKENEIHIWQKTVNLPTRASSIYALALFAHQQGYTPRIIVENKDYQFPDYRFYRYKKEDIELAAFLDNIYLNKTKNVLSVEVKKITIKDIKNHLKQNKILLLRVNTKPIRNEKRNTSNHIIVHDYKENYFQIIDSKLGGLSISSNTFQEAFETLETKKYRNHQMVVFFKK